MKSFKAFISENRFRSDIPTKEWLDRKQESSAKRHKFMGGTITGSFDHPLILDPQKIRDIPGFHDEHKVRETPNHKDIDDQIGHPGNFNTENNPILICVNFFGHPYVMEGNHRLGYAVRHKKPFIHAVVRYMDGGELADGAFHPSKIKNFLAASS